METIVASTSVQQANPNQTSRLYPGFGIGIVLLWLGMAVSVAVLGLTMPYYNKAAADMVSSYEALLFNSHLPPEFLVYPAVLDRVLLGTWYQFVHALGFQSIWRLEDLPPPTTNLKTYETGWQMLVQSGRVFSLLTGIVFVTAFILLVRRWIGVWQIAILAGIAWAFSSGNALGFRMLRPEMMTATMVFSALLIVLIAAKDGRSTWRFPALAAAGLLVALAIMDKVQSIVPALAILPLALAFGPAGEQRPASTPANTWIWALLFSAAAAAALWPAAQILLKGVALMPLHTEIPYKPLSGGMSGRYQFIIAGGIVAAMAAYAVIWRLSLAESLAGIAAVGLGLGIGFDLLYWNVSDGALVAVANPIEHLQAHSEGSGDSLLSKSASQIQMTILKAIGSGLAYHTFVFWPQHRPTLIIEWLALAGMVYAYRKGRKLLALQIALLIGCAIAEDSIFSLRQVKVYYLPYSDTPIILAGVLALSQFADRLMTPAFERATAAVMIVYVLWGHAQPGLAVYSHHDRGKVCGIVVQFTKRITIPYCAEPPK